MSEPCESLQEQCPSSGKVRANHLALEFSAYDKEQGHFSQSVESINSRTHVNLSTDHAYQAELKQNRILIQKLEARIQELLAALERSQITLAGCVEELERILQNGREEGV
jgi:hypothetical protein